MRHKKKPASHSSTFRGYSNIGGYLNEEEGDENGIVGSRTVVVMVDGAEKDAVLLESELGYLFYDCVNECCFDKLKKVFSIFFFF